MNANTYPLTAHLSPGSISRLVYWSIAYALSHPGELNRARLAAGLTGDKYQQAAAGALIAAAIINATPGQ
jgi:hypothetical protein